MSEATGAVLRDAGMATAIAHAEKITESWGDRAAELARKYAASHAEFATEDLIAHAREVGFPEPPDPRAWGGVIKRLASTGVVRVGHYRKSVVARAHCRPVMVWWSCR
jgi:hypothetical protein